VIKFTTLFGLLAVELGVFLSSQIGTVLTAGIAGACLVAAMVFVWRSFYAMRIES